MKIYFQKDNHNIKNYKKRCPLWIQSLIETYLSSDQATSRRDNCIFIIQESILL